MDTMMIEVITPDCRDTWTIEATSYTVHANGTLDVVLPDDSVRHFDVIDWMDVRLEGTWQPGES